MTLRYFRTPFPFTHGEEGIDLATAPAQNFAVWNILCLGLGLRQREGTVLPERDQLSVTHLLEPTFILTVDAPRGDWTARRPVIRENLQAAWEEMGWPGSYTDHRLQFQATWTGFARDSSVWTAPGTPFLFLGNRWGYPHPDARSLLVNRRQLVRIEPR